MWQQSETALSRFVFWSKKVRRKICGTSVGAKTDELMTEGNHAVAEATDRDSLDMVRFLIAIGADKEKTDDDGDNYTTALLTSLERLLWFWHTWLARRMFAF